MLLHTSRREYASHMPPPDGGLSIIETLDILVLPTS